MKTKFFILFLSFFICAISYSQRLNELRLFDRNSGSNNQFFSNTLVFKDTTDKCDIALDNSILLKDVEIIDAGDSVFTITKWGVDKNFPVTQIKSIKFINHGFANGMIYGVLASTVFWGVLGLTSGNSPENWFRHGYGFIIGFILGIPTGLISGLITEFATKDDIYDFGNANASAKAKRLKYIMSIHK